MLGRQQIAGVPTAISEVFKNAYDAYATTVRGDFFPAERTLLIRDNGVGMTLDEFESRWLTIGTDSKTEGTRLPPITRPAGLPQRRQMGEKGIGRLAIATLSPQLLIVTRGYRTLDTRDDHLTVALVQWSLFESPGLTLEDVVVPIRRVRSTSELTVELIESMRDEFNSALAALEGRLDSHHMTRVRAELGALNTNIARYMRLNGPRLDTGSGTLFVLSDVYEDLDAAMRVSDTKRNEFSVSEFQRFLLGFTNTISSHPGAVDFDTEFVLHEPVGPADLIDPSSYFWDSSDFSLTDHTVEGEFDNEGTFRGQLSIYGKPAVNVVEPWSSGHGEPSACGPFRIKFGYVQGQGSDSRLAPEDFSVMTARLEKIGGLYVYRDGIRVLPYGNSDYDYLDIEQRRSLNAARYFFSYRRMFGAIDLDSQANSGLQEKAGREGFRQNRAYRDFRAILREFFVSLAASHFSSQGTESGEWRDERDRLKGRSNARRAKARAEQRERDQLILLVREVCEYIETGSFSGDVRRLVADAENEAARATRDLNPEDLSFLEARVAGDLAALANRINVTRPADLALTSTDEKDLTSYENLRDYAAKELVSASRSVDRVIHAARGTTSSDEARWRRSRLESLSQQIDSQLEGARERVRLRSSVLGSSFVSSADASLRSFRALVRELIDGSPEMEFAREIEIGIALQSAGAIQLATLDAMLAQIDSLSSVEEARVEVLQLKEELLGMQEQLDANLELLQLGQAVQIVSHEFETSIRSVRNSLKSLSPWAKATPRLQPIVRDLRESFAHLDGYLRLFTPLQRRLYRESVEIYGDDIERFLRGVFSERLERHGIRMTVTDEFRAWVLRGYPSTFYPVFVNLLDNAIHWLSIQPGQSERQVTLDTWGYGASIRDNGPGVRQRDREAIFERGFSRRRGGRGLGLSLAKELLERDRWTLELSATDTGAEFVMLPPPDEEPIDD